MMILPVLLLTTCLHLAKGRSMVNLDIDNDINVNPTNDWVKISQPPKRHITKNHGQRLELECEAMGSPPPTIQWFKEQRLLTVPVHIDRYENNIVNSISAEGLAKVKSRLVLNYLLPVHEGTFRCLAESGVEKAVAESRVYVVNKEGLQMNFTTLVQRNILGALHKPRVTLWSPDYMDVIGREVLLPCQGVGNPRPLIQWVNPEGEIIEEGEGRIAMLANGELRIRAVTWSDMGVYTCVAKNHLGEDSEGTFLYPMQES